VPARMLTCLQGCCRACKNVTVSARMLPCLQECSRVCKDVTVSARMLTCLQGCCRACKNFTVSARMLPCLQECSTLLKTGVIKRRVALPVQTQPHCCNFPSCFCVCFTLSNKLKTSDLLKAISVSFCRAYIIPLLCAQQLHMQQQPVCLCDHNHLVVIFIHSLVCFLL